MKKLLLALTILFTIYGCEEKDDQPIGPKQVVATAPGLIPDQYIVFMTSAFAQPLITLIDTTLPEIDPKNLDQKRAVLIDSLKKYFTNKGINVDEKNIFVDVSVGAVLKNITPDTVKILLKDSIKINNIVQDFTIDINADISINPIQQTDPLDRVDLRKQWLSQPLLASRINPIQQSPDERGNFDIIVGGTSFTTRAISVAGGPVTWTSTNTRKIWFLDTGIDTDNPNLNVRASLGTSFIPGTTTTDDENGHGTFCAGIAAGKPVGDAEFPLIHYGLSEGAPVVPVKVLDQNGQGEMGYVVLGLNWVAIYGNRGDIVNLSLGAYDIGNSYDPRRDECYAPNLKGIIQLLAENKKIFVTMAAGNNAGNAKSNLPGCINGPNRIFTVSSVNSDLTCAEYANFNVGRPRGEPVDYVTVGTRVFSLWKDGGFRMASGTSVSSALVAGIIHVRGSKPIFDPSQRIDCEGTGPALGYKLATR